MSELGDPHAAPDPHAARQHADVVPHRHERPEDWGWHGSAGKWARIGGWFTVVVLCLFNVTTFYNTAHTPWLYGTAAVLVLMLIRDHFNRKNAWRN